MDHNFWINGATGTLYTNRFPTGPHDSYGSAEYYDGTTIYLEMGNVNGGLVVSTASPPPSVALSDWNMITTTVNGSGWQIYLNGNPTPVGSGSWLAGPGNGPIFEEPFASHMAVGDSANGSMADFSLYGQRAHSQPNRRLVCRRGIHVGWDLPAGTPMQIAPARVFDLPAAPDNRVLADLGGGGGTVNNSPPPRRRVTLSPSGGTTIFSGAINDGVGTVALVMNGAGTQVLAGSSNYSGGTTVRAACSPSAKITTWAPPAAP